MPAGQPGAQRNPARHRLRRLLATSHRETTLLRHFTRRVVSRSEVVQSTLAYSLDVPHPASRDPRLDPVREIRARHAATRRFCMRRRRTAALTS